MFFCLYNFSRILQIFDVLGLQITTNINRFDVITSFRSLRVSDLFFFFSSFKQTFNLTNNKYLLCSTEYQDFRLFFSNKPKTFPTSFPFTHWKSLFFGLDSFHKSTNHHKTSLCGNNYWQSIFHSFMFFTGKWKISTNACKIILTFNSS